jgi:hypothetical protein
MDVCLLWVLCVEVSATGWSLVQRSPTECGVSESVIVKPRQWGGLGPLGLSSDWWKIMVIMQGGRVGNGRNEKCLRILLGTSKWRGLFGRSRRRKEGLWTILQLYYLLLLIFLCSVWWWLQNSSRNM